MPEQTDISNFDAGEAFSFIKERTGRIPPKEYVLKKLKQRQIQDLSIPEDLEDHKDLHFIYKLLYAPDSLSKKDLYFREDDPDLNLSDTDIKALPDGLEIHSYLYVNRCVHLKKIPPMDKLKVGSFIGLDDCTSLTELPVGFKANVLSIWGCTALESLPHGLNLRSIYIDRNSKVVENILKHFGIDKIDENHPEKTQLSDLIKKYVCEELDGEIVSVNVRGSKDKLRILLDPLD